MTKTKIMITTIIFLTIFISTINLTIAPSPLKITVKTDKLTYQLRETVEIYGNVTYDDNLIDQGLAGIQVKGPMGTILTRTKLLGPIGTQTFNIEIPQLAVLVLTDKQAYTYRSLVGISGKLWLSGEPIDGLIGVEVINPNNQTLVVRAVPAGTPTLDGIIEIVAVTPCDQLGNPKYTFKKGVEHAHVNVTVRNNDIISSRPVIITVVAYDNDSTPILPQVACLEATVPANGTVQFKPDFPLDSWLSTGSAKFYASVFSNWPRNGGTPYTAEKSAQFTITSTEGSSAANINEAKTIATTETGSYNLTFRLPPTETTGAPLGTYTINVSAYSQGYTAKSSTTFTRKYQLNGDVNFDHKIDILDIVAITSKYGSKSGDPNWNPEVDIQPSGKIDISDVVVATSKYGQTY